MTLIYIPLDERPCNADYPRLIFPDQENFTLITLPRELMGLKKRPAPVEDIHRWLEGQLGAIPSGRPVALVASAEMLLYGGLLPSRLHGESEETLLARLDRFMGLMDRHRDAALYLSALIMRSPTYNSSDEEPDYYADYGAALHLLGRYAHLRAQGREYDRAEEDRLVGQIPGDIIADYRDRRRKNKAVLERLIRLTRQGRITLLSLPQDDTAPHSFPSLEREELIGKEGGMPGEGRLHNYPGADETGCSLVGRALVDWRGAPVPVVLHHSHREGLLVVPHFEDRPLEETISRHLAVAGLQEADNAPVHLVFNLPMETTRGAEDRDWTGEEAHPPASVLRTVEIIKALPEDDRIILVDLRFTNGGDRLLLKRLDRENLLGKLDFYSAWNTCGNAIGTACGAASSPSLSRSLLALRILEDAAYMAGARKTVRTMDFPPPGDESDQAREQRARLAAVVKEEMVLIARHDWPHAAWIGEEPFRVSFPWSRCFEISLV